MSLEIIIGKNKTGKTKYLEENYQNTKESKTLLFIKSEIDFDKVLKGNEGGSGKNEIPSPHKKIINFLNNIIGNNIKVQTNEEEYNKFIKFQETFEKFKDKLNEKEEEDNFFEECIKNSLETSKLNKEFNYEFELIKYNNKLERNGSSGSLHYSLIKILYEMLLYIEELKIDDKFTIVIDEIEKFLHPELVFKVANMITKISEKINVVLTTHSPIFLERIFYIHKNKIINNIDWKIKYHLKYEFNDDPNKGIKEFEKSKIEDILRTKNYRTISNLARFLFSSKCFFIEGLLDNSIINSIINDEKDIADTPYTIIDCNGKEQVETMLKIARDLSIIPYYKICLFYDSDSDKNEYCIEVYENESNYIKSIVNDPNIEERFFELEKCEDKKIFVKIKEDKKISLKKFKREEINNYDVFNFSPKWIIKNTTKSNVDEEIKKLKEEIVNFLL